MHPIKRTFKFLLCELWTPAIQIRRNFLSFRNERQLGPGRVSEAGEAGLHRRASPAGCSALQTGLGSLPPNFLSAFKTSVWSLSWVE